jgi:tetratricopeptide (TPR) repeat protein
MGDASFKIADLKEDDVTKQLILPLKNAKTGFITIEVTGHGIVIPDKDNVTLEHMATDLMKQEKYDRAVLYLEKVISRDSQRSQAHFKRGRCYLELGKNLEVVEQDFKLVTLLEPTFADGHYYYGKVLDKLEHYEEALEQYDALISINPNYENGKAHAAKGWCLIKLAEKHNESKDEYLKAIHAFEEAIAIDNMSPDGTLGRAVALLGVKEYESAITACDEAIHRNYTDVWIAQQTKARCLFIKGTQKGEKEIFEEALELYNQAIAKHPTYDSYLGKARVLVFLSRYEESIVEFDKALYLQPNDQVAKEEKEGALSQLA